MNGSPNPGIHASNNHGFGIPVNNGKQSGGGGPVNIQRSINNQQLLQQQQAQQMQLQQKQRMILQQRAIHQQKQQQASQNYEAQFYHLLMTLNEKPKRVYNFVETADLTLKKYEQYRPSFEFHIYENNYKICAPANTRLQQQQKSPELTSDGLILNKNNAVLKDFLECVARGKIPESIMEVLRDCNIQFYEGNLILQVYDHTNTVDVAPRDQKTSPVAQPQGSDHGQVRGQNEANGNSPSTSFTDSNNEQHTSTIPNSSQASVKPSSNQSANAGSPESQHQVGENKPNISRGLSSSQNSKQSHGASFKRPRVYRTLLMPNDLTQYYDMMSYADHTRFSDSIYQQLESEILSLTKRNLSLDVPLNPYEHRDKLEVDLFACPQWDSASKRLVHPHREESKKAGTKGLVGHIDEHEELPQNYSNYEQMMMIMSERTTTTTNSTFAASLTKNTSQTDTTNASKSDSTKNLGSSSGAANSSNRSSSNNQVAIAAAAAAAAAGLTVGNENNQFSRLKFIEQWRVNKEKRKQQALNSNIPAGSYNKVISMATPLTSQHQFSQQQQQPNERSDFRNNDPHTTQQQLQQRTNGKRANNDKTKVKRPRKTKKNTEGENGDGQAKKKRATKKKQNDNGASTGGNDA